MKKIETTDIDELKLESLGDDSEDVSWRETRKCCIPLGSGMWISEERREEIREGLKKNGDLGMLFFI